MGEFLSSISNISLKELRSIDSKVCPSFLVLFEFRKSVFLIFSLYSDVISLKLFPSRIPFSISSIFLKKTSFIIFSPTKISGDNLTYLNFLYIS